MERPINFEQTDRRWRNVMYSNHGDARQTIGTSGCGPTCAAMVISEITGKKVFPTETCKWALNHNFRTYNNGTSWSYFEPQLKAFGIECHGFTSDYNKALDALKKHKMVICLATKGLWTSSGHFILAYAVQGNTVYINDPNSTNKNREEASLSVWKSQCKKFWIVGDSWMIDKKEIKISIDGNAKQMTAVNVDGENYIRIRDIAPELGYAVDWDAAKRIVVLNKE